MAVRLATIALLAALALAVAAAATPAGDARPSQVCAACGAAAQGIVSTAPTFVVSGRGWGHGVGMSQWGAYGYARRGRSYAWILGHYYRGTELTRQPTTQVRVLLAQGRSSLALGSSVEFRVRDATGKVHRLQAGELRLGPALRIKTKGAEKAEPLPGPLTFMPGATPLSLGRPYRGWMQVSVIDKKLQVVNLVSLESYLYGVVPDEVPDDWPPEALKAQAVAARSYALATRKTGGTFDLYDDTRSQVYGGVNAERFATTAAVDATARQVVTYRGRVAVTYFFSTSGGRTAAIQDAWPGARPVPYLVSVPDPHDTASPYHRWGPVVFSAQPLRKKLRLPAALLDVRTTQNPSARVSNVIVVSPLGQVTVSGSDVRTLLGLRSTWFRVGVLSVARPIGAVPYGSAVQLTGVARGVSGPTLQARAGEAWDSAAKLTPAPDGTFSARVTPEATTTYRVAGGKALSPPLRVPVAAAVRLSPGADSGVLRGTVRPALAGVRVVIERQSGASWITVASAQTDAQGAFRARLSLSKGLYRAVAGPGRGLVTGTSPVLRVVAA